MCDDVALSVCSHLYRLQWVGHIVMTDDSRIPKKVIGGHFGGRRPLGKPRHRWEDALGTDAIDLLPIRTWKAAVRKIACWRKEIGEVMARKWAEAP